MTSKPSPSPSTTAPARPSVGRPLPRSSKNNYARYDNPVLQRPIELAQYTSIRFTETLALEGLAASIGTVGDALDNAAAESFMGLYKNEAIRADSPFRRGPLRQLADVETLTMNYVHWSRYAGDPLPGHRGRVGEVAASIGDLPWRSHHACSAPLALAAVS